MPKGQFPKLKEALCNIQLEHVDVSSLLPRTAESYGLVIVKLKKKLEYKGHVLFELVQARFIVDLLSYLKRVNYLYKDITIVPENKPQNLQSFVDFNEGCESLISYLLSYLDEPIEIKLTTLHEEGVDDNLEIAENLLDTLRVASNKTTLISNFPNADSEESIISIAPGEGQRPMSVLNDDYYEELAHPHLFPKSKFGYKVERDIPLSPSKYFNQQFLNYTQQSSSDSDCIFFAHSFLQQLSLNSQINIAMQNLAPRNVTAGMLTQNFKETVKQFSASDEAFSFMNSIKGTPAYWKKFLSEALAMVKQLGLSTYFLTLSCADLRWNKLISIVSKVNKLNLSEEKGQSLSYQERCKILNINPVLEARHFQYRVEVFFK